MHATRRPNKSLYFMNCVVVHCEIEGKRSNLRCVMAGQSTFVSHWCSAISRTSGLTLISRGDEGKSDDSWILDTQATLPFVSMTNAKARQRYHYLVLSTSVS